MYVGAEGVEEKLPKNEGKVKVNLSLCLTKHYAVMTECRYSSMSS
jgi:hypothetical protein